MTFSMSYDKWKDVLTQDEQDFVQALLVMKSPRAAGDMCGLSPDKASKLFKKPQIKMALDLSRAELREQTHFTPADVVEDLMVIRDMALGRLPVAKVIKRDDLPPETVYVRETSLPVAQKAVESLGRMLGVFTDKKEISIPASDTQLLSKIEEILGVTVDGDCEDVTESSTMADSVNRVFERRELEHIKSMSLDSVVDELLSDPLMKMALEERLGRSGGGE